MDRATRILHERMAEVFPIIPSSLTTQELLPHDTKEGISSWKQYSSKEWCYCRAMAHELWMWDWQSSNSIIQMSGGCSWLREQSITTRGNVQFVWEISFPSSHPTAECHNRKDHGVSGLAPLSHRWPWHAIKHVQENAVSQRWWGKAGSGCPKLLSICHSFCQLDTM